MLARIFTRTGADAVLQDPDAVLERTAALSETSFPFLATAGRHIASFMEVDQLQGMRAAVALAPNMTCKTQYLDSLVGTEKSAECIQLLKHVESTMNTEQTRRLHQEIALAVGTIH